MTINDIKRKVMSWAAQLNEAYVPTNEKPVIKIAELVLILPALGLFYLWEYFNRYQIEYFLFFEIKDAISVLYKNLMPIIYIVSMLSLMLPILLPSMIQKNERGERTSEQTDEERINKPEVKLSRFTVFLLSVMVLVGLYVIMDVYKFGILLIAIFLFFAVFFIFLYLFVNRNIGFGFAVLCAFLYAEVRANIDAKNNMKNRPRFDIALEGHADRPILRENDSCRHLIYKTSNYYFIKDDCKSIVYAYAISGGEIASAKVEKKDKASE